MRHDLPSGTVTFLFTDVEGSTRLLSALGEEGYGAALASHREIIRASCVAQDGVEVDTQGDAVFFAFGSAPGALQAVADLTEALASGPISVRVGLHTGTPLLSEEGYVGHDVHRAARIAAAGHGGQVLVSASTASLVALALTDLGEHRLKDIDGAVSIFQLGDGQFPPLKTISNTNLPRPASSFVGRETELAEVLARVEAGARLVTLTGPGGTGKTRLALEAAMSLVPDYKAGVFWVGLASLRDPALVAETVSQTLGAKDGLQEHIGERELLLLLDNLEQVIEAAPELSALLKACPNLTLLVTSRELLRISGEVEYSVPPLAEPEAVTLFCERAQTEPSPEISELCTRLDSLPLAVELAAARTKALSPAQILERLSSRLDLLKGGRDADPRQQTLRATIEWSYELLTPEEQQLFARLSVFAGGCTMEAAEAVCDADLDSLQSLVEKSLLRFSDERYWMLETVREYARERLTDESDHEASCQRHALWCLKLAEDTWSASGTEGHVLLVDELGREHVNVRTALTWTLESQRNALALRFGEALWEFWYVRSHLDEAAAFMGELLALDAEGAETHRAWALFGAGTITRGRGDFQRASDLHLEAFAAFEDQGARLGMGTSLADRGSDLVLLGDLDAADSSFLRGISILREASERRLLAYALNNYSILLIKTRRFEEAASAADEALGIVRAIGDRWGAVVVVGSLAVAELGAGRLQRARQCFVEELREGRAVSSAPAIAEALEGLASIHARVGHGGDAARLWGASEARLREIGSISESGHDADVDKERVESELGPTTYQELNAEGASWSLDKAVEFALASLD